MKAQKKAFLQMLSVIGKDGMLLMACLLPVVCGILFRLGIPGVEALLCTYFQKKELLSPFYGLTDVFYSMLAPAMFCFAAAMVVLEERDEGMASYLCITPLGRNGYLISRLGVPAVLAAAASGALLIPFSLQRLQGPAVGILAVNGGAYGLLYALLILRFSSNRLEGMAAAKLSSLLMLPAAGAFFIHDGMKYLLWIFPSYWAGLSVSEQQPALGLAGIVCAAIWGLLLF